MKTALLSEAYSICLSAHLPCTGLWNQVFLGYNLCLFLLLPFAYFFTESEGLAGSTRVSIISVLVDCISTKQQQFGDGLVYPSTAHPQGIMSRVYETVLLLLLLAAMAAGLAGLLSSLLSSHEKVNT